MAFTTPGESSRRHRHESRKVSHGHENVAVIKEPTPQPGHAINLRGTPRGGNSEPSLRALAGEKSCAPTNQVALRLLLLLGAPGRPLPGGEKYGLVTHLARAEHLVLCRSKLRETEGATTVQLLVANSHLRP